MSLSTDLLKHGNILRTIACQKKKSYKIALSHKTLLKKRLLWLKLNCLNPSYQLDLKMPFGPKQLRFRDPLNYCQPNHIIWGRNQISYIDDYMKQSIVNIHNVTTGEPKEIMKLIFRNAQAPKFLSQKYGAGALQVILFQNIKKKWTRGQAVYSNHFQSYCNCKKSKGIKKLKTIYNISTNNPNFIFSRIYNLITLKELYMIAYQNLKWQAPSNITNWATTKFPTDKIQNTITALNKEKYNFPSDPHMFISGPSQTLPPYSFENKIIQEVIRIILEAIYEPTFLPYSHAFRKGKGCHSALKTVQTTFTKVKWLIIRDVTTRFTPINHHKLINILHRRISDQRFINLIWKLLHTRHINNLKTPLTSLRGSPHGKGASPILLNIYIHELDLYIRNLIKTVYKGPQYKAHQQLLYVRYADSFLIGILRTARQAHTLKKTVTSFLSTSLLLIPPSNKSSVLSATKDIVKFLGADIGLSGYSRLSLPFYKHTKTPLLQFTKIRDHPQTVRVRADMKFIIEKLNTAGFCNKLGVPTPQFQFYVISKNNIVLIYNKAFQRLKNYFLFVDNFKPITLKVQYILIKSCAKLLAAKLKLKTAAAVFKTYGGNLSHNKKKLAWAKPYKKKSATLFSKQSPPDCLYIPQIKKYVPLNLPSPPGDYGPISNIKPHHINHGKSIKEAKYTDKK